MKIRPARSTDADAVNVLLHQLGYFHDDKGSTAARIRAWADDTTSDAFIAEVDGTPLGVIAIHICPFFERPGAWGRITTLVVSDQARAQGIGSCLIEAAESYATRHGCIRMEVTSSNGRTGAHQFYQHRVYFGQAGVSSRFLRDLP